MRVSIHSGTILLSLVIFGILTTTSAFGQTSYEIDISKGAGFSAYGKCAMAKNCFYPNPLSIPIGSTVIWRNTDKVGHFVVSGKSTDDNSGSIFDSNGVIRSGSTFQFTFVNAGTYDYFCAAHPWMSGQVIVGSVSNVPITQIKQNSSLQSTNSTSNSAISAPIPKPTEILSPKQQLANGILSENVNPAVSWDTLIDDLSKESGSLDVSFSRTHALVYVAMYDALVVGKNYENNSKSAIIAGAASEVLSYLFPHDVALISKTETDLANVNQSVSNYRVSTSLNLGHLVGKEIVKYAKSDGFDANFTGTIPTGNCTWEGTDPPEPMAGSWKTFIISSGAEIQPPPPYPCNSKEDRLDVAKVLAVSLNHTSEEIVAANKWGYGNVIRTWDNELNNRIQKDGLNISEATRAHAYLDVAMYDAFVSCWHTKYTYWTARPVQRIPELVTLLPTPNFPSYTSAHATVSGAASQVMAEIFPTDRDYFIAQAKEAAHSRLWAGIHYEQDNDRGLETGNQIGNIIVNDMRSKSHTFVFTNKNNAINDKLNELWPSPLKQINSGIIVNNVNCNQDFQLMIKLDGGYPACVTPQTARILIERGWGNMIR